MMEMLGVERKARKLRCDSLLEQFNITKLRKALAMSLSGGEAAGWKLPAAWSPIPS